MIVHVTGRRRGLSLLELMLALVITTLVGAAIAGMLGAVTSGLQTRRDTRTTMVNASAASARVSAYVVPSRCVLECNGIDVVLWCDDARESGTVHASEVRWLLYNASAGTIELFFVSFPDDWSPAARDLEDLEYPLGTNWMTVLNSYDTRGWIDGMTLVDGLNGASVSLDALQPVDSRHLSFRLSYDASVGTVVVPVSASIHFHEAPSG